MLRIFFNGRALKGHSNGNPRILQGHLGTKDIRVLEHWSHCALKVLEHLGTRALENYLVYQALRQLGTWGTQGTLSNRFQFFI